MVIRISVRFFCGYPLSVRSRSVCKIYIMIILYIIYTIYKYIILLILNNKMETCFKWWYI